MLDARWDRLDPRRLEPLDDLVGMNAGGEVNIVAPQADEFIAHCAANVAGQALIAAERVQ